MTREEKFNETIKHFTKEDQDIIKKDSAVGLSFLILQDFYEAQIKAKDEKIERLTIRLKLIKEWSDVNEKIILEKDEEIERLTTKLTLCDDAYSKVANDFESAVMEIERLKSDVYHMSYVIKEWQGIKARSIVAMLFWDMKEYDRYSKVNNVQDYVSNKNKFYALESVFKKAYAILKDKQ